MYQNVFVLSQIQLAQRTTRLAGENLEARKKILEAKSAAGG
jgi:hypothetical protein